MNEVKYVIKCYVNKQNQPKTTYIKANNHNVNFI